MASIRHATQSPYQTDPEEIAEMAAAIDTPQRARDRPDSSGPDFWRGAMGIGGIAAVFAGAVLVFFFAAAGVAVLAAGFTMFALAFHETKHDKRQDSHLNDHDQTTRIIPASRVRSPVD